MENFKNTFNNWINEKTDYQLEAIDKICVQLDINTQEWFSQFLNRQMRDYSGDQFLGELLSHFIFYIQTEFQKILLEYIPAKGKNIYQEPYLGLDMELKYALFNNVFYIKDSGRKNFRKLIKTLPLSQREDLMQNKLFSQIVNQTNLVIFNKRELRTLKLRKLNEYHCDTEK